MKKFVSLFWFIVYIVGVFGGIGYAAFNNAWFILVCIIMLGVMAYHKFCEAFNDLNFSKEKE